MEFALTMRQRLFVGQYAFGVCLLPVCAYFLLVPFSQGGLVGAPWMLVHSLNLLAHEAGHFFFRFFGDLMMFAGGSILQLLLPCAFLSTAVRTNSAWSAQISLLWLGQNWIDVSIYAGDAVARQLPLIGNLGAESHDWYNILGRLDLLPYTDVIASGMVGCAIAVWTLMLIVPRWLG